MLLRERIYSGEILLFPPTLTSLALTKHVWGLLSAAFGDRPRQAQATGLDFFHALAPLRQGLAAYPTRSILAEIGEDPDEFAVDSLRLRGVLSGGHRHPDARPAYSLHRDTWYANPRCQLNVWIPLHPVTEEDGLSLLPDFFGVPLANTSAQFDYSTWGGFQKQRSAQEFPVALNPPPVPPARPMNTAEILVFSAAHLHGTHPQETGKIRFSLDFRAVHRQDHAMLRGARDPDNASTGDAGIDYRS